MIVSDKDRRVIENKYHLTDKEHDPFNRFKYHGYGYDESTGLDDDEIKAGLAALSDSLKGEPHPIIKAKLFEYVLKNTRIDINEHDYFVGIYTWDRVLEPHTVNKWIYEAADKVALVLGDRKRDDLSATGYVWTSLDYHHNVPDWDSIAKLGLVGMLDRLDIAYRGFLEMGELTESREIFYRAARTELCAVISLVERMYEYSLSKSFGKQPIISESLKNLVSGAPQTTLDMLQLMYVYFMTSESTDLFQVRTLGYGLDGTLYPFFKNDIESGRFTKDEIASFIGYFMLQFSAIGNYWGQPLYLGGTNPDGTTRVNELSRLILDVYDELGIYNPKIQIKYSKSTPRDFLDRALKMIIGGTTSIVFCNEETIIKAMMRGGATYEEACMAVVKGCYEYAVRGDSVAISCNVFNALKPVELVFNNGTDPMTEIAVGLETGEVTEFKEFKDFWHAYLAQLDYAVSETLRSITEFEKYAYEVNPSLMLSLTLPACANTLTDAYDCGVRNVSDMWFTGLGTATDAVMAVYELVYETRVTTLDELKKALKCNWIGYEDLRARALSCKHKYGNGDRIADLYAGEIHRFFASRFNGAKNGHGGNIEYELHSARSFIDMGRQTGATPDGRLAGEEFSKNASPTMGMDKKGITALIRSATSLDLSIADSGTCLDCMLHPSSVQGEEGREILYGVLSTYMSLGGASIHFNIFNADTLRDAQRHPEKYQSLQVRVCGWNVLWNNMSRDEQDAYIKRAEAIAE